MTGFRHAPAALLALAVLAPALAPGAEKLSRQEVAQLGKAATAYVHVKLPGGTASGSAFCVHPSGLFVTNQHVIDGATAVTLVLNPGRKDQKVYAAEVRYADAEADLALLRVADATGLPALALGSDDGVAELTEVVACGFPFGEALAVGRGEYPAVSINAGAVTALRRKGDALHRLQLDASLNPGNSGGPVLGPDGKVVGVVVAGVKGSGVNFAIPVSHVTRFVDRVDLRLAAPALGRENFRRPTEFAVTAAAVLDADKPLDLELALWAAGEKPRRHKLELKDGAYRATAQVFPVPDGPPALRVTATYGSDSVSGSAADAAFRVGGQEVKLADVRSIARDKGGKGHTVRVAGDKVLTGDLTGLDRVSVAVGGKAHEFDLQAADAVTVDSPTRIPAVRYTVVATRGGREVGRLGGVLVNEDVARKAYLSDLPEFDVRVGFGSFGKNGELGYEGKECIVNGARAAKGLSTHPPHNGHASVKYRLGRKAYTFRTGVGLLDSPDDAASPCTFEVLGDGRSLWKSKPIKSPKVTDECQLDLSGVDVLELRVSIPGDFGRARAIWVDPHVLTGDAPAGPARAGAGLDPAIAGLVGKWKGQVDGLTEIWTVQEAAGKWTVTGRYLDGDTEVGNFVGESVQLTEKVLSYVHVYQKQPFRPWLNRATCTAELIDGKFTYTWRVGGSSGTRALVRVTDE
jgi:S1-C subfamily serine protease